MNNLTDHTCIFCEIESNWIIAENDYAVAMRDGFPVTPNHTLIIPKRHISSYFDLTAPELKAVHELLVSIKESLETSDQSITGFNVGVNSGASAGQTIFHCHIHLFPRRDGDVDHPRGGVRHTIPGKGNYQLNTSDSSFDSSTGGIHGTTISSLRNTTIHFIQGYAVKVRSVPNNHIYSHSSLLDELRRQADETRIYTNYTSQ